MAGQGNTIVVAGGGGAGGSKGGGSGSKGGGGNGGDKPTKSKGLGGSAIKLDDNTFYWVIGGALLLWGGIHLYQTNPGLIQGFINPLTKIGQPSPAEALPPGTQSPQLTQPQTDYLQQQQQQQPYQDTSMQGYPYGQGMGGSQAQYQSPQMQQPQPYQSMGQQYQQYPPQQQATTQWNAANGQNSNSFAASLADLVIDSEDGELKLAD